MSILHKQLISKSVWPLVLQYFVNSAIPTVPSLWYFSCVVFLFPAIAMSFDMAAKSCSVKALILVYKHNTLGPSLAHQTTNPNNCQCSKNESIHTRRKAAVCRVLKLSPVHIIHSFTVWHIWGIPAPVLRDTPRTLKCLTRLPSPAHPPRAPDILPWLSDRTAGIWHQINTSAWGAFARPSL